MFGIFHCTRARKLVSPAGLSGTGQAMSRSPRGRLATRACPHWQSQWSVWLLCVSSGRAQTSGNSSLSGVVSDPTGAVVPGATVEIHNPVSQFSRSTTTDGEGRFTFTNVPFNPYHLSVTAKGFGAYSQDLDVRSAVPLNLKVAVTDPGVRPKRHGRGRMPATFWKTIRRFTPT